MKFIPTTTLGLMLALGWFIQTNAAGTEEDAAPRSMSPVTTASPSHAVDEDEQPAADPAKARIEALKDSVRALRQQNQAVDARKKNLEIQIAQTAAEQQMLRENVEEEFDLRTKHQTFELRLADTTRALKSLLSGSDEAFSVAQVQKAFANDSLFASPSASSRSNARSSTAQPNSQNGQIGDLLSMLFGSNGGSRVGIGVVPGEVFRNSLFSSCGNEGCTNCYSQARAPRTSEAPLPDDESVLTALAKKLTAHIAQKEAEEVEPLTQKLARMAATLLELKTHHDGDTLSARLTRLRTETASLAQQYDDLKAKIGARFAINRSTLASLLGVGNPTADTATQESSTHAATGGAPHMPASTTEEEALASDEEEVDTGEKAPGEE